MSAAGEVPCDVCTEPKLKALKSCLVCLVSYCETHLEPHLTMSGMRRHQLIDPMENLESWMCTKHDKLLELFCKTDKICVCMLCTISDHKTHDVVPLEEGFKGMAAELKAESQQMINKRRLKIQEFQHRLEVSKKNAERAIADGVQVFTALKKSVERSQDELIDTIKEKQRKTEKQAEGFIKELEKEISDLKKSTEMEQLSRSEDHLLQSLRTGSTAPPTKNWTEVRVSLPSYVVSVKRAVNPLEKTISKEIEKLLPEVELKRVQQSAVDVTLDPDTAHPQLILSDDGKQVTHGNQTQTLPYKPGRFDTFYNVLAKQSFSSGRFYYEVQVKDKYEWSLGVVIESINRKGEITDFIQTQRPQSGFWTISCPWPSQYYALGNNIRLPLKCQPEKVGVFVDYEEGLVFFYDVDAAAPICSFPDCSFTEKLYPFFKPGFGYVVAYHQFDNSAPMIICPVNHTE